MKKINIQKYIFISVFLLTILALFPAQKAIADTDPSTGSVTIGAADNDPPSIIEYYAPVSIIPENQNVTFYCLLYDLDNTSTELNVTLFYSLNSFGTINNSVNLTFSYSPQSDQYRFSYEMIGQVANTLWQFYYMAYDGETRVYVPSTYDEGNFLWIQWVVDEYSSYIDVPNDWDPFGIFAGIGIWILDQGWIILVGLVLLFFLWRAIERAAS